MPDIEAHNRTVRRALSGMTPDALAQWRTAYLPGDEGGELRVRSLIERIETKMRAEGKETTIRTLWLTLADLASQGDPDVRAGAGLTAMAMGLRRG
jgi:hypothetical protein